MNKTKILVFISATLLLSSGAVAFAQDASTTPTPSDTTTVTTPVVARVSRQPQVVEISAKGNVLLRGTVSTVGAGSITVKSWGGDWTITVGANTEVMPHESAKNDVSDIHVGDFVGVLGTVDTNSSWTVNAKLVKDWTSRKAIHTETKANLQSVRATEKAGHSSGIGKIFEGTASNVTSSSFTLTAKNGTAYTVNVTADTKTIDRAFHSIGGLSVIQEKDHIRVFGTATSGTITSQIVRDTSLPR